MPHSSTCEEWGISLNWGRGRRLLRSLALADDVTYFLELLYTL